MNTHAWPADKVERRKLADLNPYEKNSRTHTDEQIAQIARSIEEWGWTIPILIDEAGTIIAGHARVLAAKRLDLPDVPCMIATGWTDAQKRAYVIADNKLAENAGWDDDLLRVEIEALRGLEFDTSKIGFSIEEIDGLFAEPVAGLPAAPAPSLSERFGAVPFSVLNAREGWWQERKREWLGLGIRSEVGRGENLLGFSETLQEPDPEKRARMKNGKRKAATFGQDLMRGEGKKDTGGVLMAAPSSADPAFYQKKRKIEAELGREITTDEFLRDHYVAPEGSTVAATGTSIFDPVLCELMYRWFAPAGGQVFDPFAGGSVRGVVANRLGLAYQGIELREEQVEANRAQGAEICRDGPPPVWTCGDSLDMDNLLPEPFEADMIFSCPPYADLEIYSDISAMDYDDFLEAYRGIIAKACARLRPDRFAAFVIGEVRGPGAGAYRNFVGDTIQAFLDAGMAYYNEIILVTPAGSLPIRIAKQFNASRKVGKTHQNVLVFCKGDPKAATAGLGAVDMADLPGAEPDDDDAAGFEVADG